VQTPKSRVVDPGAYDAGRAAVFLCTIKAKPYFKRIDAAIGTKDRKLLLGMAGGNLLTMSVGTPVSEGNVT